MNKDKGEKIEKDQTGWQRHHERCASCKHFYHARIIRNNPVGNKKIKVVRTCRRHGYTTHRGSWCPDYEEKRWTK